MAAKQGHADVQFNLSVMYEHGLGVAKNNHKSFYYRQLAANQHHSIACLSLSLQYANGVGVEKDEQKAREYHHKAITVKQDDPFRQYISNRESKHDNLTVSPSLLSIIHVSGGMKGLYEYVLSPNVDLSKSCIPKNPSYAQNQRGPTCGLNALEMGLISLCSFGIEKPGRSGDKSTLCFSLGSYF